MKIYNKRGQPNHKEKLLIKKLTEYFEKNPDKYSGYDAPSNFDDLKAVHDQYCIEVAEVISETKNETTHEEFRKATEESIEQEPDLFTPRPDPMNRDEPKIRDYVMDDGFKDDQKVPQPASNYSEPTTFKDSFDLPDDNIQGDKKAQQQGPINSRPYQAKTTTTVDPDAKIKRKSKKKFTKYAVDAVCALAGRGIVWYATSDITNEKLQEAVANDEISKASLDMLVYLDANTQGTVKQFFEKTIVDTQHLAEFTQDEKDDLAEALEDFLEYKKIEINPTINVGVIFLGMLFERALKAMQMKAESASILSQLKTIHASHMDVTHYQAPPVGETVNAEPEANPTENPAEKGDSAVQTEEINKE
jgi:hypothetical protein